MKWGLWNYGLQNGHTRDWDLQLPCLTMGYRFSWKAFRTFFSPCFLLFGCELKLLTTVQRDVIAIINLDNPKVWLHACK
jgi:hypothetical protein